MIFFSSLLVRGGGGEGGSLVLKAVTEMVDDGAVEVEVEVVKGALEIG